MKSGIPPTVAWFVSRLRGTPSGARASLEPLPARLPIESLESRLLLSRVGAIVDAGDSFFNYTSQKQDALLRVTDQVTVGFFPSSDRRRARLEAALVNGSGPLAGYQVAQRLNETSILLERTARGRAPMLEPLLAGAAEFPNLKFLAPTFIREDGARTAAFDQLYVDLRDDADPYAVFAKGFATLKPAIGTNAFYVTVRRGGGPDVFRVAAKLRRSPLVTAVEPSLTVGSSPAFVPGGALDDFRVSSEPAQPLRIGGIGDQQMDRGDGAQTSDDTLVVRGFGHPDFEVSLALDGKSVGSDIPDDDGLWAVDLSATPLPAGDYTFVATAYTYRGLERSTLSVHVGAVDRQGPWITDFTDGIQTYYGENNAVTSSRWTMNGLGTPGNYVVLRGTTGVASAVVPVGDYGQWTATYQAGPAYTFAPEDMVVEEVTASGAPADPAHRLFSYSMRILRDVWAPRFIHGEAVYDAEAQLPTDSFWLQLQFGETVSGLSVDDFVLTRDGVRVPWNGQTIDGVDGALWSIDGLANLTETTGVYALTRSPTAPPIIDAAGNVLAGAAPAVSFVVAGGTAGADTFRLSASITTSGAVDVIVNGVKRFTTTASQIYVNGLAGDDVLIDDLPAALKPALGTFWLGGAGADRLVVNMPGAADDDIDASDDRVTTIMGDDVVRTLYRDVESVFINTGAGNDSVSIDSATAAVMIDAGDGNDTLTGGAGAVRLDGGPGDDTINARDGIRETIDASEGRDTLFADGDLDKIFHPA
jgi:hypothetical protein